MIGRTIISLLLCIWRGNFLIAHNAVLSPEAEVDALRMFYRGSCLKDARSRQDLEPRLNQHEYPKVFSIAPGLDLLRS